MKTRLASLALLLAVAGAAHAAPMAFNEVSLLVRMREADSYIVAQLSERLLLRALTPEQEAKLKAQGASESVLQALRNPAITLPLAEAEAFENWNSEQKEMLAKRLAAQAAEEKAEQAARVAAIAAWRQEQEDKAARDRALAQAAARNSTVSYSDYGTPYYGSYGYPYYGSGSSCVTRPAGHSSGSLQWSNGTATTYTSAGLSYHPLGSNGASAQTGNCPPVQCAPAHRGQGEGRFGRR